MTDTMLLLSCMKCKRITLGYAAEVLGISSSTLRYKINNDRDFKVSEVDKLCHLLGLNRDQRVIMTRPTPSVPGCSGCATLSIGASRMSWSSST